MRYCGPRLLCGERSANERVESAAARLGPKIGWPGVEKQPVTLHNPSAHRSPVTAPSCGMVQAIAGPSRLRSIPVSAFDSQHSTPARPQSTKSRGKAKAADPSLPATARRGPVTQDVTSRSTGRKKASLVQSASAGAAGGGAGKARTSTPRLVQLALSGTSRKSTGQDGNNTTTSALSDDDHNSDYDHTPPPPTSALPHPPDQAPTPHTLDTLDWADPRQLPDPMTAAGRLPRRADEWRALELGGYRVALHDVATAGLDDLGQILVDWEGIVRWRARVEKDQQVDRPREDEEDREVSEDEAELNPTQNPPPPGQPQRDAQPSRSTIPPNPDDRDTIPLPSSAAISRMARWPLHPSLLCQPPAPARKRQKPYELLRFNRTLEQDAALPLGDALADLVQRESRKVRRRSEPSQVGHAVRPARSAYAAGGPFAGAVEMDAPSEAEDEAESEDEGNLSSHSLDSELDEEEVLVKVELEKKAGELLAGMVGLVKKGPMPALDYWSKLKRTTAATKEDKHPEAVGWQGVLSVVQGMKGLPPR